MFPFSFLHRNSDDNSWIATKLIARVGSTFHCMSTLTGKRSSGRNLTLQNLYKVIEVLIKHGSLANLSKDEKLILILFYFNNVKEYFDTEWLSYKHYRLTHIVCLNALAIAEATLFEKAVGERESSIDYSIIIKSVKKLKNIERSSEGPLRYIKGMNGYKALARYLIPLIFIFKINFFILKNERTSKN